MEPGRTMTPGRPGNLPLLRQIPTLLLAIAALLPAVSAPAQDIPTTFEFSFSNPGARSLGLGGAFAALADDATAAFANPAGLVQLLRPEVSVEGRHWSYSTTYVEGGRYEGEPTGIGLDTVEGLRTAVSEEDVNGLSFLSFVYPKGNWSMALYRHQLAKFRARTQTQGLFSLNSDGTDARSIDRTWSTDLDIISYGVSGAYRIHEKLSLGVGLAYFDGQLESAFDWHLWDDDSSESFYGPNSYLPYRQVAVGDMLFDGSDWGINVGLLSTLSERWRVAAFYRQGPEFDLAWNIRAGPAVEAITDVPVAPGSNLVVVVTPIAFPDVYGLGIAYRSPDGRLAIGFEWDRVEYSTIIDSLDPTVLEAFEDLDLDVDLAVDDGDELHLGGEYAFLQATPVIAIRLGVWLDPDHRFRSISSDPEHRALFPPGDDELHLALGAGLAFAHFQVDVGVDFSDLVDTASLSVIYSF
jgi:long-subunit fatty acid transport protein